MSQLLRVNAVKLIGTFELINLHNMHKPYLIPNNFCINQYCGFVKLAPYQRYYDGQYVADFNVQKLGDGKGGKANGAILNKEKIR